jgi:polygalacturonase
LWLAGSPNLDDDPPAKVRWEGRWVDGRRALISAWNAESIAVVGHGHIAGNPALGSRQMPGRAVLIEPIECKDVLLEGFSDGHTSMWSMHPVYCENFTTRNLTIRSTGGDSIDVDFCRHVVIDSCNIDTGDDAIAIKSGRGMEGYRIARLTSASLDVRHVCRILKSMNRVNVVDVPNLVSDGLRARTRASPSRRRGCCRSSRTYR